MNQEIYNDMAESGIVVTREIVTSTSTLTKQGEIFYGVVPILDANAIQYFNRHYSVNIVQIKASSHKDNN
jgi:hypothetical protein